LLLNLNYGLITYFELKLIISHNLQIVRSTNLRAGFRS